MTPTHNRKVLPAESETVEWKQSLGEWKEIVETCAAFASSEGGTVYVGVGPKGEAVGVEIGKGSLEDLANKVKINTDPPQFPSIAVERLADATVVMIRVAQNPVKPNFYSLKTWHVRNQRLTSTVDGCANTPAHGI